MTELLVLLSVALLICVIFMALMTWLYFKLSNEFRAFIEIQTDTNTAHNSTEEALLESMQLVVGFFETLLPEAEALHKQAQDILDVANDKAVHARETMQNARKLLTKENNVFPEDVAEQEEPKAEEEKPFVFVEKEEDENDPRS